MTGPISLLVCVLGAVAPARAQQETVWSSVAFMLYGERTPLHGPTALELTPVGAQQMHAQGSVFRARYLDGINTSSTEAMGPITAQAPIDGLEPDALDNSQLAIVSTADSYVAAGALAFLQGLYPPQTLSYAYGNGGRESAVLANNSVVAYPLSGYQYPLVQTASVQDPALPWIAGHVLCTEYNEAALAYRADTTVRRVYESTRPFYDMLWPNVFQGTFQQATTNFYYAYDLYDYAAYAYNHNPQIANALNASELAYLRLLAYTQQLDLNANLSVSGAASGDMIQAVSGRMLASYVLSLLAENISSQGSQNKLNLLFGSFEPFLAFFALAGLSSGPSAARFQGLPGPGAAMVFELYTTSDNSTTTSDDDDDDDDDNSSTDAYPNTADMRVRFLYRENTDSDTALNQYSLFANDDDDADAAASMAYDDFQRAMSGIGIKTLGAWCTMCGSVSSFCSSIEDNSSSDDGAGSSGSSGGAGRSGSKTYAVTPPVAGVIGALVALGVVGLAAMAAMLLGGVRLCHVGGGRGRGKDTDQNQNQKNNGLRGYDGGAVPSLAKVQSMAGASASRGGGGDGGGGGGGGGFKGAEKKASDTDVVVSAAGAHHERVGSWELRDNEHSGGSSSSSPGLQPHSSVVEVLQQDNDNKKAGGQYDDEDDDHDHDLGLSPTVPVEHV